MDKLTKLENLQKKYTNNDIDKINFGNIKQLFETLNNLRKSVDELENNIEKLKIKY